MPEEPGSQAPAPATEPTTSPQEAPPADTVPEATPSEPVPATETPTAQIPPDEPFDSTHDKPLPPEPEPIETTPPPSPSATDGHSEPPSAAASTPASTHRLRDFLTSARAVTQDRKRKKRDKIMTLLNSKNKNGSTGSPQVTNDDVEKLLHVSDATATRYLSALEKENKIKQVGKTGHGVVYSKI